MNHSHFFLVASITIGSVIASAAFRTSPTAGSAYFHMLAPVR